MLFKKTLLLVWFGLLLCQCSQSGNTNTIQGTATPTDSPDISFLDINAFTQDSLGYIWIATMGGLNRYNGYEYRHYLHDASDTTSISHDFIFSLLIDSRHRFWVGNANGISRFYPETNTFRQYHSIYTPVYHIYEDYRGGIWAATPLGIQQVDPQREQMHLYASTPQIPNVRFFWEDKRHHLWMGLNDKNGMCYLDHDRKLHRVALPNGGGVLSLYMDKEDKWWLGTTSGMVFYDPDKQEFIPSLLSEENHKILSKTQINFIKEYEPGILLIGTSTNGLYQYNIRKSVLKHNSPLQFNPLQSAQLHTCFIDNHHNVWMGTYDKGLVLVNRQKDSFNTDYMLSNKIKGKFVTRVVSDSHKNIWIGTRYDGLYIYQPNNTFTYISPNQLNPIKKEFLEDLYVDSQNGVWIALESMLLYNRLTPEGELIPEKRINLENVRVIKEDTDGNILVGTWSGLYRISDLGLQCIHKTSVTDITLTQKGTILFSVFGEGVYELSDHLRKKRLLDFPRQYTDITTTCVTIFHDHQGRLWIGSYGNGLLCVDGSRYHSFCKKNGLTNNNVLCFQEDENHDIWCSTSYGISKIKMTNRDTLVQNFFKTKGIIGDQYHEKAGCRTADGRIFFGGNHGLTFFHPQDIKPNISHPSINLEDLKIFNESVIPGAPGSVLEKNIAYTGRVTLNHKQTSISIDYAGIDYSNSGKLTYKYKLEGFDRQWNHVGNFRRATYSNLPSGTYRFCVYAINEAGIASEHPAELIIVVKPAPWFTWQAWTLYLLIIVGCIVLGIRRWTRIRLKKQLNEIAIKERKREREIEMMKINFFTNISHELRTPLTLIAAPLEQLMALGNITQTETKSIETIARNVYRLKQLCNQLMDFSKIERGVLKLKVEYRDVMTELSSIYNSFTFIASKKRLDFRFIPHTSPLHMWIDPDKLEKIVYNLLSNGMKVTPPSGIILLSTSVLSREEAVVRFGEIEENHCHHFLQIVVSDSGPGIPQEKLSELFIRFHQFHNLNNSISDYNSSGIGLNYTKTLVEIHKGKIAAHNKPEGGMEFAFILPMEDVYDSEAKNQADNRTFTWDGSMRPVTSSASQTHPSSKTSDGEKYTLMIVEDNIELMEFVIETFAQEYKVLKAENGRIAVDMMENSTPDLIISDIIMPEMTGYELCTTLKSNPAYSHIPIILLTAKTSMDEQIEGLENGANAYICKPFNIEYLRLTVRNLLETKEAMRRFFSTPNLDMKAKQPVEQLNPQDQLFMNNLQKLLERELSNVNLNIDFIAQELGYSRSVFYRKIKGVTSLSPNDFLNSYRLKRAAELILRGDTSLTEVSERTGFSSYSYFSKSFKAHFNISPKDYADTMQDIDRLSKTDYLCKP